MESTVKTINVIEQFGTTGHTRHEKDIVLWSQFEIETELLCEECRQKLEPEHT